MLKNLLIKACKAIYRNTENLDLPVENREALHANIRWGRTWIDRQMILMAAGEKVGFQPGDVVGLLVFLISVLLVRRAFPGAGAGLRHLLPVMTG